MSADEAAVSGKGYVAFEDVSAHARTRHCRFDCLFRELERLAAAVANGEISNLEGTVFARLELVLEGLFRHVVDDVGRVWS